MGTAEAVERGREAFGRAAWADAYAQLSEAAREDVVEPEDLQQLAVAAALTGRDAESARAWERAHHALLRAGEVPAAVRCAFWLALGLLQRGETARGGGWLARAQRQLVACGQVCVERGYLLFPQGFQQIMSGDAAAAYATFGEAADIAEHFGDTDLATLARHGQGRALLHVGETEQGAALLDEAMVAVTAEETSPVVAGTVYCSVIEACHEIFDVKRAQEWTAALGEWCASQPDLVPFRGQCLVHRSQVCQLHGEWSQALDEVRAACARLADPPGQAALGLARYQQAELHRLRGDFDAAEVAYRTATEHGHIAQPGLALLRLGQGRLDAAVAAIRHAVDGAGQDRLARARLQAADVELLLAAGHVEAAREAADEL